MNKLLTTLTAAALLATPAHAQVLGKALSLQQSGLCNFLSCDNVREVQITPRIKFVGASAGAGAFYVDGKLAAIGKQGVWSFDPQYPTFAEANAIAKLGVGIGAPAAMKEYIWNNDLDIAKMEGKNFLVRNGVFKSSDTSGDFGLFLIDKQHYALIRDVLGRDDAVAAHAIVNRCFRQNGIQSEALNKNLYRISNTPAHWEKMRGCLSQRLTDFGGLSGVYFPLPAFSGTVIDLRTSKPNGDVLQYLTTSIFYRPRSRKTACPSKTVPDTQFCLKRSSPTCPMRNGDSRA